MQITKLVTEHTKNVHAAWSVHDGTRKLGEVTQLHTSTAGYSDQGPFRADSSRTNITKSQFATLEDAAEWLSKEARREDRRDENNKKMAER